MTRLLDEIADQVAFTWGLAMHADELRLVWTNMRGTARPLIDAFLSNKLQTLTALLGAEIMALMLIQPFSRIFHNRTLFVWFVVVDCPLPSD